MLKSIATFVINRLIVLGLGYLAYTFITGQSRSVTTSVTDRIETFEAPFKAISRALD